MDQDKGRAAFFIKGFIIVNFCLFSQGTRVEWGGSNARKSWLRAS